MGTGTESGDDEDELLRDVEFKSISELSFIPIELFKDTTSGFSSLSLESPSHKFIALEVNGERTLTSCSGLTPIEFIDNQLGSGLVGYIVSVGLATDVGGITDGPASVK